jgi:hypothetical protein
VIQETIPGENVTILSIFKPLFWGMVDIAKAIHIGCIQLDEFGDKCTPMKTPL